MGYTKNIGHNLLTQILKITFGVVTGVLVARALGPACQGYIAYIILIFTLLGNFGHLGIISAVTYHQKRSGFERLAIYSTNVNVLILFALAICGIIIILRSSGVFLTDYSWSLVIGGLLMMICYLFIGHHQAWLTGDERIILNNQIGLSSFFLKSGSILLLWLWGALTFKTYFWISVLALLMWLILIQIKLREEYIPNILIPVLKAEFAYGSVSWASTLFAFLHYRADQIMIKQYLGSAELGIYTIAVTIAELLFLLPISINTALTGRLYNLPEDDNGKQLLARTTRISWSICFALCLIAIPGSLLIPLVYSAAYAKATSIMLVLLPGVLFACIPKMVSPWFFSSGRPKVHLRITFICLVLNVVLNFIFIPLWGSLGAALASSISYFFYGLYYILMLVLREGFSLRELICPDIVDLKLLQNLRKS